MDEIKDVIAGLIQNYEVIRDSEVMMSKEANSICLLYTSMLPPKPVRIPLRQRLLHLRVQARQRAKQLREPRTSQKE